MNTILSLYKPRCMTPLQAINHLKEMRPELKNEKISYAGRLDPMAQGLLILLLGDENKKRHEFENLDKTYEFTILFGIETDTYDVLGKITGVKMVPDTIEQNLKDILPNFTGKRIQEFPPYSSQTIDGKPMYYLARNNLLKGKLIPTKEIEIINLTIISRQVLPSTEIIKKIIHDIDRVQGDFRQDEIRKEWENVLKENPDSSFTLATLQADVTSGTYIRSLVHEIGKTLSTSALAYSIIRTRVGDRTIEDALTLTR